MGTITLTINAESSHELIEHVKGLQTYMLGQLATTGASHVQAHAGQGAQASEPKKEDPKATATRTRAPKATTAAEATNAKPAEVLSNNATVSGTAPESVQPSTENGTKTKEDVATALQNLTAKKELGKAKEVLARFKNKDGGDCARMSDIQAGDYDDFVATCEAEANA